MRYKKTHIIVKETNPKKNPNLHNNLPYASRIGGGREWLYKEEELLTSIAEYLVHNPYNFIVLRNKIPEKEKTLRKTLDALVDEHNLALEKHDLILKLGDGKKPSRLKKAKRILREMGKE